MDFVMPFFSKKRSVFSIDSLSGIYCFLRGSRCRFRRCGLAMAFLLTGVGLQAQMEPPPEISVRDEVGVDVVSGSATFMLQDLRIGSGESMLSHTIGNYSGFFWGFIDNFYLRASLAGTANPTTGLHAYRQVTIGHKTQAFKVDSGSLFDHAIYKPFRNDGATLVQNADNTFTYTASDGTVAEIGSMINGVIYPQGGKIIYPNGFEITIHQRDGRVQSVTTNTGLQMKYVYRSNILPQNPTGDERSHFQHPSEIIAVNNAIEYCNPAADNCSLSQEWPRVRYDWPTHNQIFSIDRGIANGVFSVIDAEGRVTRYHHRSYSMVPLWGGAPYEPRVSQVTLPEGGSIAYDYGNAFVCKGLFARHQCQKFIANAVIEVKREGATYSYSYAPDIPYAAWGQSSGPKGAHHALMATGGTLSHLSKVVSPEGIEASYYQNDSNLIRSAVYQGKQLDFEYDSRQNLIKATQTALQGSAEAGTTIVTRADYASECNTSNRKWCNKPNWVEDAKGAITHYTYYDEHGQVKTITQPPDRHGVRAQTRYYYTQRYAWYKNVSGNTIKAPTPLWLLTEERSCSNGSAAGDGCADPTKLVILRYDYGPDEGPNNLWLRGIEHIADGQTLRTCYQYDHYGNVIAETAPRAAVSHCY